MSIEKKYIEDVLHPFIRPHNNQFSSKGRGRAGIIMMMDNDGKGILAPNPRPDHYDNDVHNVYAVRHGLRAPRPYHCPLARPIKSHLERWLEVRWCFIIVRQAVSQRANRVRDNHIPCPCLKRKYAGRRCNLYSLCSSANQGDSLIAARAISSVVFL